MKLLPFEITQRSEGLETQRLSINRQQKDDDYDEEEEVDFRALEVFRQPLEERRKLELAQKQRNKSSIDPEDFKRTFTENFYYKN